MSSPYFPSGSDSSETVPPGHVRLVLTYDQASPFYLEIPLDIIKSVCLKPRKYLIFLGIETDGALVDGESYYYVTPSPTDLSYAVDLEVIKQRSNVPSDITETRQDFRERLLKRDVYCVWTGTPAAYGAGMHIIPYRRGSEWFRIIVENRPHYNEDVGQLNEINDIRNGVFVNTTLDVAFDLREAVILKTPNYVLSIDDVPQRLERAMPGDVKYPDTERYTLQRLTEPNSTVLSAAVPHNGDAAFKKHTWEPKPSDLSLHYNYGAAAVKLWGHGEQVLQTRLNLPRPSVLTPTPIGSSKTVGARNKAVQKREGAQGADGDSQGDSRWDEDDVMLFFWGNSEAAKERHRKKQEESTQRMEQWREAVPAKII